MRTKRLPPGPAFFLLAARGAGRPATAQEFDPLCPDPLFDPYVFLLLDTSGSMNYSTPCSQVQLDAGECSLLCPTGDCFVPLQGDDPASKFYQLKEGLQTFLAGNPPAQLGFASFNQDALGVRAKHWLYQAQTDGPVIPGWGAYPAAGTQEVFGLSWGCDTGSNDNEIGCYSTKPADLPDVWELSRVQRLPKAGSAFNQAVIFYLRNGTTFYKVTYTPAAGSTAGAATVNVTVRVDRCSNSSCSATTLIGQSAITWARSAEFISWDNAFSSGPSRSNPELAYFSGAAMDASTSNFCNGWDPNTDTTSDRANNYNLRWPTSSSDPRGSLFTVGDVIPLDWQTDHNLDVQRRLAPSLNLGLPAGFDIASYLRDVPSVGESFLRLKNESARPLIASGGTPLGAALRSFRTWYAGCPIIRAIASVSWISPPAPAACVSSTLITSGWRM